MPDGATDRILDELQKLDTKMDKLLARMDALERNGVARGPMLNQQASMTADMTASAQLVGQRNVEFQPVQSQDSEEDGQPGTTPYFRAASLEAFQQEIGAGVHNTSSTNLHNTTYEDFKGYMHMEKNKMIEIAEADFGCHVPPPDNALARFVMGALFNTIVMLAITLNILVMGVETELAFQTAQGKKDVVAQDFVERVQDIFNYIFTAECILRFIAMRRAFFCGVEAKWNILDLILVAMSWGSEAFEQLIDPTQMRIVRIVRIVKVLRVFKIVRHSRSLRTMISAIAASLLTLLWLWVLLFAILSSFAIFFIQVLSDYVEDHPVMDYQYADGNDFSDYAVVKFGIERYMSSLPYTVWSLLFISAGALDWYALAEPLGRVSWIAAVVFTLLIVFVNFGVLNVIIGIFVANAADNLDPDLVTLAELEQRAKFVGDMQFLFDECAGDDGKITWEDYQTRMKVPEVQSFMRQHKLDAADKHELFQMFDLDGGGSIDLDEFIFGCLRLAGEPRCADVVSVLRMTHLIEEKLQKRNRGGSANSLGFRQGAPAIAA